LGPFLARRFAYDAAKHRFAEVTPLFVVAQNAGALVIILDGWAKLAWAWARLRQVSR
jgi:hypothetical protein